MDHFAPIEKACVKAGGLSALARTLGVAPSTVHQWLTLDRPVPPRRCSAIERATDGEVSRKDLRPNDWAQYWPELDSARSPASPDDTQPPAGAPDNKESV
ncbi:TPA: helix-turn-helix domain-containing protein [Burkholderia vietnamiensis]|uniref:transcriptional regulator n=1 Tax=Burkholderia vietnamiensis TaxID=60552 RepID=UPI0015907D59|nr:helix-turn-helix domain-containing protein [Burkholderia vietnamiensis]HDR8947288.1 helix-turn-helix domain-containing protein [Burkholderia vietnamiensis]HDR9210040.1 helix-turn-helix domain-containing protein [Burkholderia vietnamiensis]